MKKHFYAALFIRFMIVWFWIKAKHNRAIYNIHENYCGIVVIQVNILVFSNAKFYELEFSILT